MNGSSPASSAAAPRAIWPAPASSGGRLAAEQIESAADPGRGLAGDSVAVRAVADTEVERVLIRQLLVGIVGAHEPVKTSGLTVETQFLSQRFEALLVVVVPAAGADIGGGEVDVHRPQRFPVAHGGHADQPGERQLRVDLERYAALFDGLVVTGIRRDPRQALIRFVDRRHRVRVARLQLRDLFEHSRRGPRDQAHCRAAGLVALGVVANQTQTHRIGRLEDHLAADERAVAVVVVAVEVDVVEEAVALEEHRVEPARGIIPEAAAQARLQPVVTVGTEAQVRIARPLGIRQRGDDADDAGGTVASEKRALRSPEHLDAFDRAEFREPHRGAVAVHAVHVHAHGRLDPRVVAVRSDAADARGYADGFRLTAAQVKARRDAHQCHDVRHA